jgi:hypothetical protein
MFIQGRKCFFALVEAPINTRYALLAALSSGLVEQWGICSTSTVYGTGNLLTDDLVPAAGGGIIAVSLSAGAPILGSPSAIFIPASFLFFCGDYVIDHGHGLTALQAANYLHLCYEEGMSQILLK